MSGNLNSRNSNSESPWEARCRGQGRTSGRPDQLPGDQRSDPFGLLWIYISLLALSGISLARAEDPTFLLHETFAGPQLTANIWDAPPEQPRLNYLGGGYLALSGPQHSLYSIRTFERVAGRCLAIVYCGNMHRGGADNQNNPSIQFASVVRPDNRLEAGPGFVVGQRQGPTATLINTAVPFGEGVLGPAFDNDNVDTLFLTVLRERGAFYLTCGEPDSAPPAARLRFVSDTGGGGPYHAALAGGRANSRIASVDVMDLPAPWKEPFGLASVSDTFWIPAFDKPDKGFGPWLKTGEFWSSGAGRCHIDGAVLTETLSRDQYIQVTATPTSDTRSVALLLRAMDASHCLRFELTPAGTRLILSVNGQEAEIAAAAWNQARLELGQSYRLAARLEGSTLQLFVNDRLAQSHRIPESALAEYSGGTLAGFAAVGRARFQDFVNWPCVVTVPQSLAERLPEVPLRADGDLLIADDFEGGDGLPMDGRKPKVGKGIWRTICGDWYIEDGAARIREKAGGVAKRGPASVIVDCGSRDVEITATIEFPEIGPFPHPYDNWFPGFVIRTDPAQREMHINARYLWQNSSPEIEVWDQPANTTANREKWRETETGPWRGHTASVLVGGSNITGWIRPGARHVLRVVVRGNRISAFRDDVLVATSPTRVVNPAGTWVGLSIADHGNTGCKWLDFRVRGFKE
jgi:hypothetical protein